jgi:hypothetical protein
MEKCICVIDGQGGGIGVTLIKHLREAYGESVQLIALGTNAVATAQMLKAGANKGATGENAICGQPPGPTASLVRLPLPGPTPCWGKSRLG